MNSIFEFSDYRDYLKLYYEEKKKEHPFFSYQMFGKKLDISPSSLFCVLEKKLHLPVRCAPAAKKCLGLTGRASQYFDLLLAASRTKRVKEKERLMAEAFQLKDIQRRALENDELSYLRQWWTVVVRSFLQINQGKVDAENIAKYLRPQVSADQVKDSLTLLKNLGFIRKAAHGRVKLADAHLTIGAGAEKTKAIREFQSQVMTLAKASLEDVPPSERDISTLTMAIDEDCVEDIKGMLQEFRRQIQIRIDECPTPTRVVQLNMAMFPVTQDFKGED